MLDVSNISYQYPTVPVLSSCSLSIGRAETCLLLGANGSGKSTLLGLVAGLKRPSTGCVKIDGKLSSHVRFGGHELMLYGQFTVEENLSLFVALYGLAPQSAVESLELWGLAAYRHRRVNDLSKGNRARVSLARAFLGSGSVILLDEPTAALDDAGTRILCGAVERERSNGSACLIATHDLARLLPIATRVIVLKDGAVLADSRADEVEGSAGIQRVVEQYRELNR